LSHYHNITKICKKYKKLAGHFKDNRSLDQSKIRTNGVGRYSFTEIHEDLLPEFLLWVSTETRQAVFKAGVEYALTIAQGE